MNIVPFGIMSAERASSRVNRGCDVVRPKCTPHFLLRMVSTLVSTMTPADLALDQEPPEEHHSPRLY